MVQEGKVSFQVSTPSFLLLLSCSFSRKYTHPSFPSFFAQGGGGEFPSPLSPAHIIKGLLFGKARGWVRKTITGRKENRGKSERNMMLSDRRRQRVARRGEENMHPVASFPECNEEPDMIMHQRAAISARGKQGADISVPVSRTVVFASTHHPLVRWAERGISMRKQQCTLL